MRPASRRARRRGSRRRGRDTRIEIVSKEKLQRNAGPVCYRHSGVAILVNRSYRTRRPAEYIPRGHRRDGCRRFVPRRLPVRLSPEISVKRVSTCPSLGGHVLPRVASAPAPDRSLPAPAPRQDRRVPPPARARRCADAAACERAECSQPPPRAAPREHASCRRASRRTRPASLDRHNTPLSICVYVRSAATRQPDSGSTWKVRVHLHVLP